MGPYSSLSLSLSLALSLSGFSLLLALSLCFLSRSTHICKIFENVHTRIHFERDHVTARGILLVVLTLSVARSFSLCFLSLACSFPLFSLSLCAYMLKIYICLYTHTYWERSPHSTWDPAYFSQCHWLLSKWGSRRDRLSSHVWRQKNESRNFS